MSVNGKKTYANSNNLEESFTTFVGGTITSKGIAYYKIYANKYLDGNLSTKAFEFELIETDSNGNEINNGQKFNAVNDENGEVALGTIKFHKEGIYYYKVKEKKGYEKFNYDENLFIIKIKVVDYQNQYIIEESSVVNKKGDEKIDFYNLTANEETDHQNPENQNYNNFDNQQKKENPNTVDYIKYFFVVLSIMVIIILVLYKYKPAKYIRGR